MREKIIHAALDFAGAFRSPEFILSGGEPLLVWPGVCRMIRNIRAAHPKSYISIQSNATLLDRRKVLFLKRHRVNVELGIDGDERTMRANRPGSGGGCYRGICRALAWLEEEGSRSTATMTVYPRGADRLLMNLKHLDGLGVRHIEIHPAFMEAWDIPAAKAFLKGYRQASIYALTGKKMDLIGRGYSETSRGAWDMVVLPDGRVLPSWIFLSFPESVRKDFYIMDFSGGTGRMFSKARGYFDALERFLAMAAKKCVTYRRISNYNAQLAIQNAGPRQKRSFFAYSGLCDDIERIDQDIMGGVPRKCRI